MKKVFLTIAIVLGLTQSIQGQVTTTVNCDLTGMVINVGSDTTSLNIYHSGHYLTHPQEYNVIAWEITDIQGNIITQDTLVDEAFYMFSHSVSITDTMNISAHLSNDSAIHQGYPVNCLVEDQVYWQITEIMPGTFMGSWSFIHNNVGVDQNTILGIDNFLSDKKELIKIVDLLGRETEFKTNTVLFYIYNDETIEKKIINE